MKLLISVCLLLAATSDFVELQEIDQRVFISSSSSHVPPDILRWIPLFNQQTPTSAFFIWDTVFGANEYVLRIYEGSVLELEIRNLEGTTFNVTGLRDNTRYIATVSSVFRSPPNAIFESIESDGRTFITDEICRNGQIYTPCLAGCIFTCGRPNIVCDRVCRPGCNCDISINVLHDGICIPPQLCPAPVTEIRRPTNLQSFPLEQNRIILAWDVVPDAINYVITVALSSNSTDILQRLQSDVPLTQIGDLIPGEEYVFRVTANFEDDISERRIGVGPPNEIQISNIQNTGFVVNWPEIDGAKSYGIRLYEENGNAIYFNDDLPRNTVQFTNLSPGTIYDVSISAALLREGHGPLGRVHRVRTTGNFNPTGAGNGASIVIPVMPLTTSLATTTTTTTTVALTTCQQRYAVVSQFLDSVEVIDSAVLPICDQNGFFVTTVCDQTNPSECFCIDADTGEKVEGSDYGGQNSGLPLDCNRFGEFGDVPNEFATARVTSTIVEVTWPPVENAFGYIVVLSGPGVSRSLTMTTGESAEFDSLEAGVYYTIRLTAVSNLGWSSPMAELNVTTLYIDPPTLLRAFSRSPTSSRMAFHEPSFPYVMISEVKPNNIYDITLNDDDSIRFISTYLKMALAPLPNFVPYSVRVVWRNNPQADFYNAEIVDVQSGDVVMSVNQHGNLSWVVTDLKPQTSFEVRVTASVINNGTVFTSEPTTVGTFTQCRLPPLDILFVADISDRTGRSNLNAVKYFMANLTQILPTINLDSGTRVALVRYFRGPSTVFNYKMFNRTPNAIGALRFLRFAGGPGNVGLMVDFVYEQFVRRNSINPTREGALQVTFIFAEGLSSDPIDLRTAQALASRTNVFAIGVDSSGKNIPQIQMLASNSDMSLAALSYDTLNTLLVPVQEQLCELIRSPQ